MSAPLTLRDRVAQSFQSVTKTCAEIGEARRVYDAALEMCVRPPEEEKREERETSEPSALESRLDRVAELLEYKLEVESSLEARVRGLQELLGLAGVEEAAEPQATGGDPIVSDIKAQLAARRGDGGEQATGSRA